MKKILFFICATMLSTMAWAGYGILVNGCEYYPGTKVGDNDGFQQYLSHVTIKNGDYCQLYDIDNKAAWVVTLDTYSEKGFTKASDRYNCTVDGCFDFYIKLKYQEDQLYIGNGSNCGEPENICPTTGFYVAGNGEAGNPWCCGLKWDSAGCPLGDTNERTFVSVPAGTYKFKVTNGTWKQCWGGAAVDATRSAKGYVTDLDGNATFVIADAADITIAFDGKQIVLTSSQPFAPAWPGTSVPSQCTDVLMQGFYYDSYTVNDTIGNGTDIYGDTRWTTLDDQVGEIGSYFDLIWLPPSALASGTGYHPRQFSNQNSDWGSRAELQALINHFHQAGTKVVADIVINHIEAMEGWCHISTQNFGEYGVYVPDPSYICIDDEVNWPDDPDGRKWATEAGECSGYATGTKDDGANWVDARDWSHSEVKVQEMFKAYMKWLKNVIGYDGWRYDKGDGFHNWHMWNYNQASEPCIAFMECWSGNSDIATRIHNSNYDVMGLDFQSKYKAFDGIAQSNFSMCQINNSDEQKPWDNRGLIGCGWNPASGSKWSKYAVTFIDSHDWFYRSNGQEFGAAGGGKEKNGISMTPAMKNKLMQACAYQLSAPGVPCVFYPHWKKYKEDIKPMINARRVAGVHSESEVTDEEVSDTGYKATMHGLNGLLIVTLGDKTIQEATGDNQWLAKYGYEKMASGTGYAIWVLKDKEVAARLVCTPDCEFMDSINGIQVGITAVGGSGAATIYYTLDGSTPTTESQVYTDSLQITTTTTLKAIAVVKDVQSDVYTYTYTYREPLKRGIQVRFDKPEEWEKVYYYAWIPQADSTGKIVGTTNVMGAFPGQRIYRDVDGWYNYEFPLSMDTVNFCISSGDDCGGLNVRSNDLKVVYDTYYKWETDFEEEDKHELLVEEPYEIPMDFQLQISPESGDFRDSINGEKVSLTVLGKKGAQIYYSTDGSDPADCANPGIDTVSFYVKQTSEIKAFAYDKDSCESTDTCRIVLTYKAPQSGPLQVRFIKPHDWQEVGLYAFTRVKRPGQTDKDTEQCLDGKSGKWPGMLWTTFEKQGEDSVYYYTLDEKWKEIYIIFNNHVSAAEEKVKQKIQTQDIYLTENTCYIWNPTCKKGVVSPNCTSEDPTGWEEVVDNAECRMQNSKFLKEGQLYIRVGDTIYDIFGRIR